MNESTLVPREEMSDLDWLARNVHAWPSSSPDRAFDNASLRGWEFSYGEFRNGKSVATKDQWLARRAELQNKPSWVKAPEWANWLAQDEEIDVKGVGGGWFWYELCPTPRAAWDDDGGLTVFSGAHGAVLGDWRDTLEKRPEQAEFEPLVSVEDAATSKQHDPVNNPSHYASGGIECIEAIKASMSHEAFLGYLKGNVQKYMWRYEKKVNPSEDLKKAQWYLSKLIEEQKQ